MKKIIAAILATVCVFSCLAASVSAASGISLINAELAKEEIHILYNDRMVQYEDVKPINNEDRIMIPFRAALENMGATVDYDDSQRLVTATKGDITIHFTLLDDTIYINNNGEESTITMDVPMIIVQDRTLVPIRFMSNALDMQVGWDGDTQTVVIMDYDTYFDGFDEKIPNLNKVQSITKDNFNAHTMSMSFSIDKLKDGQDVYFVVGLEGSAAKDEKALSATGDMYLDTHEFSVDPAEASLIYNNGKLFLKTDTLNSILEKKEDNEIKKAVNSKKWYSIDIAKLMSSFGLNANIVTSIQDILISGENIKLSDLLQKSVTQEGDAIFSEILSLNQTVDLYEQLDSYVSVELNESDGYIISIYIEPKDFIDIIDNIMGLSLNEQEKTLLMTKLSYTIQYYVVNDGKEQTTDIYIDMMNNGDNATQIGLTLADTSTFDKNVKVSSAPNDSYDITDIISSLIPHNN